MSRAVSAARLSPLVTALLVLVACAKPDNELRERARAFDGEDRTTRDEPRPGRERVFAFDVPAGVKIASRFPDRAQLTSRRPLAELSAEVKRQIQTDQALLEGSGIVFPKAVFNSDKQRRIYRIELSVAGALTMMTISDVTPPPVAEGLDTAARWERAGRNSDGSLKHPLKVY